MTQPAVSQHIQMLERDMGAKLLERNNKFIRLTHTGDIVYYHAKEIFGAVFENEGLSRRCDA
ncbi:hypothetical protein GCM10020331_021180 [Ectobacillus funiculus]